jgi:hypothetical protein
VVPQGYWQQALKCAALHALPCTLVSHGFTRLTWADRTGCHIAVIPVVWLPRLRIWQTSTAAGVLLPHRVACWLCCRSGCGSLLRLSHRGWWPNSVQPAWALLLCKDAHWESFEECVYVNIRVWQLLSQDKSFQMSCMPPVNRLQPAGQLTAAVPGWHVCVMLHWESVCGWR